MTRITIPAHPIAACRIESTATGRRWVFSSEQRHAAEVLIKCFKLPFELQRISDAHYNLAPVGILLNRRELQEYEANAVTVRDLRARLDTAQRAMGERPRFQILGSDILSRYIDSLATWPEICEVARPGTTLERVPTKFPVPKDAFFGVRFWPVMITRVSGGRRKWALTPPVAFTLSDAIHKGIKATGDGHPHVYGDNRGICVGTARFNYDNPLQVMPVLREWYVGYSHNDLAHRNWQQLSQSYWQGSGTFFFGSFPDAKVIVAPWLHGEATCIEDLTPEMVARFCAAKGWVIEPGRVSGNDEGEPSVLDLYRQGAVGAGYQIPKPETQFPRLAQEGWDAKCKFCAHIAEEHFGPTCPDASLYDLPIDSVYNLLKAPVKSRFQFMGWNKKPPAEYSGRGEEPTRGLADILRRMEYEGKPIEARKTWLAETLRKFGPMVNPDTRCVDCGDVWKGHTGPQCKYTRALEVR